MKAQARHQSPTHLEDLLSLGDSGLASAEASLSGLLLLARALGAVSSVDAGCAAILVLLDRNGTQPRESLVGRSAPAGRARRVDLLLARVRCRLGLGLAGLIVAVANEKRLGERVVAVESVDLEGRGRVHSAHARL